MNTNNELKDEELRKVVGGDGESYTRYCKYCKCEKPYCDLGPGGGWDEGGTFRMCRLYECLDCHQVTYVRLDNNVII